MKHFTTLIVVLLYAQMGISQHSDEAYRALWKKVEQLEQQGLTQSALKAVASISKKANKEDNSAQTIKALLYTSKYAMILEEDAQLKIIKQFKTQISQSDFPVKNVLESYLGNLYWQYFQQNRYVFYNRSKTANKIDSLDFRTWDLTTLFREIEIHLDNSLGNSKRLQQIGLEKWSAILNKQKESEVFRPTMFDILAHTALNFYKTQENSITRPAYKFEISQPDLLCEAHTFKDITLDTKDKHALQFKALGIYQQLIRFHTQNKNPQALVDVDIDRLKFVYENATFEDKQRHFLEALQNSVEQYPNHKVSSLYSYEIASLYNTQGTSYIPKKKTKHQWKRKEALELCDSVISKYPKSTGALKCQRLKSEILNTYLELTTERNLPIDKSSKLLVNYRNHEGLQLYTYRVTQAQLKRLNTTYEKKKKLNIIQNLPLVKHWNADLKNEGDHQQHSTEVLLPALPGGSYLILAKPSSEDTTAFAFSPIQVTDLAFLEISTNTHQYFQVIDRNNGNPVVGANVRLTYKKDYNGPTLSKQLKTDAMGKIGIALAEHRLTSLNATITYGKDKAHFGGFSINRKYKRGNEERVTQRGFLFTDRSIYRPGQIVYFKGIVMETFKDKSKVLSDENVFASLHDVNGQKISELDFETNDYGSFNGEFVLPASGLTGEFYIQVYAISGLVRENHYFSVEEYKRPKFETSFEPITQSYRVNDTILVKGKATAYAGSNITDGKVVYRVKRTVYFPRWYYWSRPYYNTAPQEIAHGETRTDASGNYQIEFVAIPDLGSLKKNLPVFTYEVTADVTDVNGETQSTLSTIRVGYHSLEARLSVAPMLDKYKSDHDIDIVTQNLNGQFVANTGTLKIYKLIAPKQVLRPRLWEAPDYQSFTKEKYKELYPYEAYSDEHNYIHWKKGPVLWETAFNTGKSKKATLENLKKWASGKYVIELESKDKFGQLVTDIVYTTLYSDRDKKLADNQLFEIKTDKPSYSSGDKVSVSLASAAPNLSVTVQVEKDRKIVNTYVVQLKNDIKKLTIPVQETDLGGFAISYSFSAYNAFQSGAITISVPYPKTDLEIETLTFRDKLKPGTDETWTFKVKGPKGERVSAELLASMYDASLDAFKGHNWNFNPISLPNYYGRSNIRGYQSFGIDQFWNYNDNNRTYPYTLQNYDSFNWFGFYFGLGNNIRIGYANSVNKRSAEPAAAMMEMDAEEESLDEIVVVSDKLEGKVAGVSIGSNESDRDQSQELPENVEDATVQPRKNLQETAFFFPKLQTDKEGNVSFSFTTPEALTKWKLQLLAHTKDLKSSTTSLTTLTQKELMVMPNVPRFLREGDKVIISSKISNLTEKTLSGNAHLELTDLITGENVTAKLVKDAKNGTAEHSFSVDSLGNTQVSWALSIPENLGAVQYTVIAKAEGFSDGEQAALPVLTNRMLVTETLPMWVGSDNTKTFVLQKLKNNASTTLKHHRLTLEMTSNPAWYAVQALPYLMEYPYDCNEQTFSRYYANTLAAHIANSSPRIKEVFDQWASGDALLSNLEQNQELKSLLIQETPWLRDAQSETEQKKRIALLFDLNKMKDQRADALRKLQTNQMSSGAWAWFKGGRENRFITQHIVTGMGHLKKLNVTSSKNGMQQMLTQALNYLDAEFVKEYEETKRYAKDLSKDHLSHTQIHYLYMRSFFPEITSSKKVKEITDYYLRQTKKYWLSKSLYAQGMLALISYRMDQPATAENIMRSLKENSIVNEELGMYWKANIGSWHWYQAPIETQALLIEAFSEINKDTATVDNLKVWLLKHKQTNQWKTTKATANAVYALLLQGSKWLSVTESVDVLLGGTKIEPKKLENVKVEAGTGYFKTAWTGAEITSKMAEVQISKKGKGIAWGGLYWQYFEDLDKITGAKTPLELSKKLFLKKNTDFGEEISEIGPTTDLKIGDLVRVRVVLTADRPMEFIHLKDMRASGLEPINVLSGYKWQDGLGYYESTKDASTNFFFDYLSKGVHVFEYDLRVNNAGDFSNGITTAQSMYAPEFSSHSEGIRLTIK
ncbi:alpha-2-macroglobulin family protein [Spongiimicrobium sp. 3-5]|uniref:alpha-2-macroglobulin family protein n=1 Tax=Spongiimicrobium sp. 3-5 TaxID=3332596 RepID=UPI00397F27E8